MGLKAICGRLVCVALHIAITPKKCHLPSLLSDNDILLISTSRLVYRGWTRLLWWEDAWAAFALISDGCLPAMDLDPYLNEILTLLHCRAARMSIIFSIVRIANSSGCKYQKWITYLITVSFVCMWTAILVQKVNTCIYACQMTLSWFPAADVVADVSLIVVPLQFWKNIRLSRNSKILILSAFGASLLITVIAIPQSIILFQSASETTLIMAHIKAAVSLIICNLLVIVTLAYRVCWKETLYPGQTFGSPIIFTSVIPAQTTVNAISMASPSVQEGTTQDN
ncbi:hypothetical protein EV702DRAFT_1042930 [Suillus placidus]|uniref:Integral membrane protein n=1 Tax=Suillus placidus TaxID=48579 RepID=A0A9P7A1M3_9AGAM|nr:hypothetical protein EV702DRAFT_1042930 [Suillus placidus]